MVKALVIGHADNTETLVPVVDYKLVTKAKGISQAECKWSLIADVVADMGKVALVAKDKLVPLVTGFQVDILEAGWLVVDGQCCRKEEEQECRREH